MARNTKINTQLNSDAPLSAHDRHVMMRREVVARLALKRMSLREIADALEKQGIVNPDTGEAYSYGTVKRDLDAMSEEWKANAQRDLDTMRHEVLAELNEVKRAAWANNDLTSIIKAVDRISKLFGLDAPERIDSNITVQWSSPQFDDDDIGLGADELP